MFCPSCGIEYRAGFTRCNDCDVDLVDTLPSEEEEADSGEESAAAENSPALLWRGTGRKTFSEATVALDAAGIPYNRENLDPRLLFVNESTALEIWVPQEDMAAAQKVLEGILADAARASQESSPPPAEDDESSATADDNWLPQNGAVEELYPEDASAEVWSGTDASVAQFLKSCLMANRIGCCVEGNDAGHFFVRVRPEDETLSRGIVRQVVEGVPPE